MATNTRLLHAPPDKVWDVLADGWLYPVWVVGAARLREVDVTWPAVGSRIHHSVGAWPLMVDDTTEVMASERPTHLKLRARGWPAGEAEVDITLEAHGAGTQVTIREDAVSGPGRLVPAPFRVLPIALRNIETLKRLSFVAERR
ncbi:SRPBCC family protein [Solicola sp. PLA-1-18]|uniref:SRPBCC family protein n=1 Tax=Solicola sp. PLA-1-18 TaxID=3380532 RepID=UPI003B7BE5F5